MSLRRHHRFRGRRTRVLRSPPARRRPSRRASRRESRRKTLRRTLRKIKRGVRRAGPRSDASRVRAGHEPDASGSLRPPWPRASGGPVHRPVVALEDAPTNPCTGGTMALRPPPRARERPELRAPACPSAAARGLRRDRPTCRGGSTGSTPGAGRTAGSGSLAASKTLPPRPGRPCAGTSRLSPGRSLPAKEPTGLNDAPPKGWRSFRRGCDPSWLPPIPFGTGALPGLVAAAGQTRLPPHVAYR